jgi:hypothetical protein
VVHRRLNPNVRVPAQRIQHTRIAIGSDEHEAFMGGARGDLAKCLDVGRSATNSPMKEFSADEAS